MVRIANKYRYLSLVLLAVLCGLLWRWEIEYHGWRGLKWISYFHWAVPFSFGLLLLWVNALFRLSSRKRLIVNLTVFFVAPLVYLAFEIATFFFFDEGTRLLIFPTGLLPPKVLPIVSKACLVILGAVPMALFFILRYLKNPSSYFYLIMSYLSMALSLPLSIYILRLVIPDSDPGYVYAIKSGLAFGFVIFSLGVLFVGIQNKNKLEVGEYEEKINSITG